MANTLRIKRRPSSGAAGSPSAASLYNGELAFNENDNTLYYAYGSGVNGVSQSVPAIGGSGAYSLRGGSNATGTWPISINGNAAYATNAVYTTGTQTVNGAKTFGDPTVFNSGLSSLRGVSISPNTLGAAFTINDASGTAIAINRSSNTVLVIRNDGYFGIGQNINDITVADFNVDTSGNINNGKWNATTIPVNKGGTGRTSYSDGQLLIGSGSSLTANTLTAGNNIVVTNAAGSITIGTSTSGVFASGVNIGNQTANTIASFDSNKNVTSLSTTTYPSLTELAYVKGVTSAIQTQIDGKAATNQTMYIGTTAVNINRASSALTLTGITSIDGNAATVTNGVYTIGAQTIAGVKTFSDRPVLNSGLSVLMAATASSGLYFPVFTSDPSSSAQTLASRTPSQIKSDIGLGNVTNDAQIKKLASSTNGNIPVWNGTTGDALSDGYSVQTTLSSSTTAIPRADAVKTYIDNSISSGIATNDAMLFKGAIDCSSNPNYPSGDAGWTYKISVAGKIGGASGPAVEVNDTIICTTDGTPGGTQAAVGSNWIILQTNIADASILVTGPVSATSGNFALFNGTTGKIIADSTYSASSFATASHTHGNISNIGAIGSTANLPIITTTNGVLTTGSFGSTANTFCQGNDSRLSDTRNTTNTLTVNNGGAGDASSFTFNGSAARTISYNSIGAPSISGTNAVGTWNIAITGNAGFVTNGVYTTGNQSIAGNKTYAGTGTYDSSFRAAYGSSAYNVIFSTTQIQIGQGEIDVKLAGNAYYDPGGNYDSTKEIVNKAYLTNWGSTIYSGSTFINTLGTITTGSWSGTVIAAAKGGTGQSSYTVGDLLYADTSSTLAKLADVATGNVLLAGGVGVAPSWGKVGLTTHVNGTLPVANGGTNQTSFTDGQLLIGNSVGNTLSKATLTQGTGLAITNGNGSISIAHASTSSLTGAQGGNGIASLTVDPFGHVIAVTTATYLTAATVCSAIVDCTLDGGTF